MFITGPIHWAMVNDSLGVGGFSLIDLIPSGANGVPIEFTTYIIYELSKIIKFSLKLVE